MRTRWPTGSWRASGAGTAWESNCRKRTGYLLLLVFLFFCGARRNFSRAQLRKSVAGRRVRTVYGVRLLIFVFVFKDCGRRGKLWKLYHAGWACSGRVQQYSSALHGLVTVRRKEEDDERIVVRSLGRLDLKLVGYEVHLLILIFSSNFFSRMNEPAAS